jgi:hypothetical protein
MPVSTKRFSEIRLLVSDLLQTGDWAKLFENCGTNDPELAKSVSAVFSMYAPEHVWKFIEYVLKLPPEIRRERRDSSAVVCYILGRIGQYNTRRSISALRTLLMDDHMLRIPVGASLSNLWILDTRNTERALFDSWVLKGAENDDLQEIAVRSSEYLASQDPERISPFYKRIGRLDDKRYRAARLAASELAKSESKKRGHRRAKQRALRTKRKKSKSRKNKRRN